MSKIEKFFTYHSDTFVFFLLSLLSIFFIFFIYYDYKNQSMILNSELEELNYAEGYVSLVNPPKGKRTSYEFYIEGYNQEFYISEKKVRNISFSQNDYIKIYYPNNLRIRGNSYNIVNFEHNEKLIYSLADYKESVNLSVYKMGYILLCIVCCAFIVIGVVLYKKNKPVDFIKEYVMANRDKYNLTDEQINEIVFQFENNPNKEILDKPKDEIYQNFKKTIFTKNDRIYTSGLELVENSIYGDIFYEVLADTVSEDELKVIYDDCVLDNGAIYVIYQIHNKKAVMNIYDDRNTKLFIIDNETLYFYDEKKQTPSIEELNLFIQKISEYNLYVDNIFDIKIKQEK